MPPTREKFATQVNSDILAALRRLAEKEGRQLQALVDEALADLIIAGLRRIDWKLSGRPPLEDPHPAKSGGLKSS